MARREFGILEREVGMAVLVMPLLKNCVLANGVLVTNNPYRPDLGGLLINCQVGTVAVTAGCGGAIAEQVLVYYDEIDENGIEVISGSSLLPKGEFLLTEERVRSLQSVVLWKLDDLKKELGTLDVEFFILRNNEIVIVQARPVRMQLRKEKRFVV
jgi:hypothetical protein